MLLYAALFLSHDFAASTSLRPEGHLFFHIGLRRLVDVGTINDTIALEQQPGQSAAWLGKQTTLDE